MYGMKEGLLALEFEDASADSLKSLLLTCFIHPTYIKSQEVSSASLHGEEGGATLLVALPPLGLQVPKFCVWPSASLHQRHPPDHKEPTAWLFKVWGQNIHVWVSPATPPCPSSLLHMSTGPTWRDMVRCTCGLGRLHRESTDRLLAKGRVIHSPHTEQMISALTSCDSMLHPVPHCVWHHWSTFISHVTLLPSLPLPCPRLTGD